MIPASVERVLSTESQDAVHDLLADRRSIFLVDWREEDDAIIGDCEEILRTGDLTAQVVPSDSAPGFEVFISHRGRRVKVPLGAAPEDRHITVHTLNQLLQPAYEIRACVDAHGSGTLAFLPLPAADWSALEARFGHKVARRFRKIEERPNLFTEAW